MFQKNRVKNVNWFRFCKSIERNFKKPLVKNGLQFVLVHVNRFRCWKLLQNRFFLNKFSNSDRRNKNFTWFSYRKKLQKKRTVYTQCTRWRDAETGTNLTNVFIIHSFVCAHQHEKTMTVLLLFQLAQPKKNVWKGKRVIPTGISITIYFYKFIRDNNLLQLKWLLCCTYSFSFGYTFAVDKVDFCP